MVDYKSRLEEAMRLSGTTLSQLAAHLGVSYQAVKKVVDGKTTSFSAGNNAEAAAFMKVNSDWLATGRGVPRPRLAWPFSDELWNRVSTLDPNSLYFLENTMRAHLQMPALQSAEQFA